MTDFSENNGKENIEFTGEEEISAAKKELDELLEEKLSNVDAVVDTDEFEEQLRRKAEELEKAKEEYYKDKGSKLRSRQVKARESENSVDSEHVRIYKTSAALSKAENRRVVKESMVHRTWRLLKSLKEKRSEMKDKYWYTSERKRAAYSAIVEDCWSPVTDSFQDAVDTAWNFLSRFWTDFVYVVLYIANIIIIGAYYVSSLAIYLWDILWDVRLWFEARKRALFGVFVTGVVICVASVVLITSLTAYEYTYYGKSMGYVKSRDDVVKTVEILGDKLSEATGAKVSLDVDRDMEFKKVMGYNLEIQDRDTILNTLTYMRDLQVEACAVSIDGNQEFLLDSQESAQAIIEEVTKDFLGPSSPGIEITDITTVEDVKYETVQCSLGELWNADDAKKYIMGSAEDRSDALITVKSTEITTYTQELDFDITYIDNASIYSGTTEVKSEGIKGTERVIAQVERVNGVEVSREIQSTEVVNEPVAEVQYRGTKPVPAVLGTGQFKYPLTSYTISSQFGMRWGSMHTGVDLAAPHGQKVYASDGGVVSFAGWQGSYGYLIIIDHGGLFQTYYAHNSKLYVSAGDKVYQGQNIALVGSTGRSTGPHVHFEVRYNGTPQNPLEYL